MNVTQILGELADADRLPVAAIEAARADRAAVAPVFVRVVQQIVEGGAVPEAPEAYDALFFVFHLLGEWREKSAYRPLAALLRLPEEEVNDILGDAVTLTSHRVMAAVFDGDPAPLHAIIRDRDADAAIRSRMFEALAMVTRRGELPREQTTQFLRACFDDLRPQGKDVVWQGWQSAIALLGMVDLAPLVRKAFGRGFIDRKWLSFADFEADLRRAVSGGPMPDWQSEREFELFGDTIEELAEWGYSDSEEGKSDEGEPADRAPDERVLWGPSEGPAFNPYKGLGRNDPCPCGSGKKYKKCCLDKADVLPPSGSA